MAHVNLHLAEGLFIGSAIGAVPLARAWLADRPVSGPILRAALLAFACAVWTVVPQILTTLGAPSTVHSAGWANIFFGHARLDRRFGDGGLLIGEFGIAVFLVGLYLVVLAAVRRARRLQSRPSWTTASG
jgi:hypothetical protein